MVRCGGSTWGEHDEGPVQFDLQPDWGAVLAYQIQSHGIHIQLVEDLFEAIAQVVNAHMYSMH